MLRKLSDMILPPLIAMGYWFTRGCIRRWLVPFQSVFSIQVEPGESAEEEEDDDDWRDDWRDDLVYVAGGAIGGSCGAIWWAVFEEL